MTDLKESVRRAIDQYVDEHSKTGTHSNIDILRLIKDQSTLLYEKQLIFDALDADHMEQLSAIQGECIPRIKNIMDVKSVARLTRPDGHSSIDAVVELKSDNAMKGVKQNIQLSFRYERRRLRQHEAEFANISAPTPTKPSQTEKSLKEQKSGTDAAEGTFISYWIDVSCDYGKKERLLGIEVWAGGQSPSSEKAQPLEVDDDEMEDCEKDDGGIVHHKEECNNNSNDSGNRTSTKRKHVTIDPTDSDGVTNDITRQNNPSSPSCDRYAAYVDPDIFSSLFNRTQVNVDEATGLFLLMTFPFYEHEWDLVGFLIDCVFGDDDEIEDDENFEDVTDDEDDDSDMDAAMHEDLG